MGLGRTLRDKVTISRELPAKIRKKIGCLRLSDARLLNVTKLRNLEVSSIIMDKFNESTASIDD